MNSINARIAQEVMGWTIKPSAITPQVVRCTDANGDYVCGAANIPDFEHSLDACALAELALNERGMWTNYTEALLEIWYPLEDIDKTRFLVCLTPTQRCEAMLKAMTLKP